MEKEYNYDKKNEKETEEWKNEHKTDITEKEILENIKGEKNSLDIDSISRNQAEYYKAYAPEKDIVGKGWVEICAFMFAARSEYFRILIKKADEDYKNEKEIEKYDNYNDDDDDDDVNVYKNEKNLKIEKEKEKEKEKEINWEKQNI